MTTVFLGMTTVLAPKLSVRGLAPVDLAIATAVYRRTVSNYAHVIRLLYKRKRLESYLLPLPSSVGDVGTLFHTEISWNRRH